MVFAVGFEYLYAVVGGVLLGIAACLNYIFIGKMTGMGGVLFQIISLDRNEFPQRLTILGGMLIASGAFFDIFGYIEPSSEGRFTPFGTKQGIVSGTSYIGFALAGFFVGFGAKLSNGCTSGHGLCGLARLNLRSFVAVFIFMATAIGIASLNHYYTLGPLTEERFNPIVDTSSSASSNAAIAIGALLPIVSYVASRDNRLFNKAQFFKEQAIELLVGLIFASGLLVSGVVKRPKVMNFLQMTPNWDPTLLIVMAVGGIFNLVIFNYISKKRKHPILADECYGPMEGNLDWKLILGALLFGLGWGIGYLCPGPFFVLFAAFSLQIQVLWGVSCIIGMFLANWLTKITEKNTVAEQVPEGSTRPENPEAHLQVPQESSLAIPEVSEAKTPRRQLPLTVASIKLRVDHMEVDELYI